MKRPSGFFTLSGFGELRVSKQDASVIRSSIPEELGPPIELDPEAESDLVIGEEDYKEDRRPWDYLNPTFLTNYLRHVFGPWNGRFSFSTELVSDTSDRSNCHSSGKFASQVGER